jgi:uncharacterized peroxidase-related enzyme
LERGETPDLPAPDAALLVFASKLTREPAAIRQIDVDALREHGFDDAAISHAVQVVALFNYYNRIADGLGIHTHDDEAS